MHPELSSSTLPVCMCRSLIDQVDKAADARQERIETDLHGAKTNLIKESIRMGHNDLADFQYGRGDLQVGQILGNFAVPTNLLANYNGNLLSSPVFKHAHGSGDAPFNMRCSNVHRLLG